MESVVGLCNRALSKFGQSLVIKALDEPTVEARQCSLLYEAARDALLRRFTWRWATARLPLARVVEEVSGFAHVYALPSDCLRLLDVVDDSGHSVEFTLGFSASGRLVLCNEARAAAVYVARVTDPVFFPPDFSEALTWELASQLAQVLAEGSPALRDNLAQHAQMALTRAIEADANEARDPQKVWGLGYVEARR